MPAVRLITIPFSHYCEKARWALERCGIAYEEDGHLPIFHYIANRFVGAKRTVPVVIAEGTRITDSTEIVAWADSRRPGTLLPEEPAARAEALALEDELDNTLGPATRRWAYYYLLPRRISITSSPRRPALAEARAQGDAADRRSG